MQTKNTGESAAIQRNELAAQYETRIGLRRPEIQHLIQTIFSSESISRSPQRWSGMRILDVSAHNAQIPFQLADYLANTIDSLEKDEVINFEFNEPCTICINDLIYRNDQGRLTKLGRTVRKKIKRFNQLSPHVKLEMKSDDAAQLKTKKNNVIIDRLGAIWHILTSDPNQKLGKLAKLLYNYYQLLEDNGRIIVDNYQLMKNQDDPNNSTGKELIKQLKKLPPTFLANHGFRLQKYKMIATTPDGEDTYAAENAAILILQKIPREETG